MSVAPDFITIVSGLPRSGTSLAMRMLEASGFEVLVDRVRQPDEDNPHGYYEFEAVKRTRLDQSWLLQAKGRAVKVVYQLLYDLPTGQEYRLLFMRRRMEEVLASQKKMLARQGKADAIPDEQLARLFQSELAYFDAWARRQPHFRLLNVDYNELMADPEPQLQAINQFLGGCLNVPAMREVIAPALYRNRLE